MSNNKQEPKISTAEGGIVARRDDFIGHASTSGHGQERLSPPDNGSRSSGAANWLSVMTLLIALAAIAGCGWLVMLNQGQQAQLTEAQNRIQDLEQRLSATGEEMDESSLALKVKVSELGKKADELWTQMDKLWASAWRRNQSEIKELKSSTETNLSSTNSKVSSATKQIENLKSSLSALTTNYDILKEELDVTIKSRSNIDSTVNRLQQSSSSANKQLENLQQQIEELSKQTSRMQKRLVALEVWQTNSAQPSATGN